ncbi:hypothetical protein [Algibacter lectus]|uniref:Uncharacterized protein n=1 Tax=Algibacter lectus TaxID=221126 RepID=A0A090VDG7_9FLAO|nr:hypothetical protein [Algibacter lectus]MWW24874.1 hypothetical protein [Algibacter lectus]TDY64715.1 hypothetical protein DFQ06_1635 [Algibacter lectus]SFD24152.1 hypothetical protein SAMN04489722_106179 [Algibacter lectus]GAL61424.1 hypothetical protein JCM19300_4370 [Algibacter lectus]GAL79329.1 hypothetical protein JCM19274_1837 [Algibacter lectus]
MKKLSNFKDNKIDLEQIQGGKVSPSSYYLVWHAPGGASTPGNWVEDGRYDYPSSIEVCGCQ